MTLDRKFRWRCAVLVIDNIKLEFREAIKRKSQKFSQPNALSLKDSVRCRFCESNPLLFYSFVDSFSSLILPFIVLTRFKNKQSTLTLSLIQDTFPGKKGILLRPRKRQFLRFLRSRGDTEERRKLGAPTLKCVKLGICFVRTLHLHGLSHSRCCVQNISAFRCYNFMSISI